MQQLYFYGNTNQCHQKIQEDAIYMNQIGDYYILIISDGNGGQVGDVNTGQLAINLFVNFLEKIINDNTTLNDIRDMMDFGFYNVSQSFLAINAISEQYRNIYASLSIAIISKISHQLLVASTGNTEIQLIRDGKLQRVNRIYSEAYENLMRGVIEEKDFYISPGRSILTSAIGVFGEVSADILSFGKLKANDVIIMTTDGVYRYLNPDILIERLASEEKTIEEAVNGILEEVKDKGGEDNASLIVGHLYNE